jgi:hypothetical protein
LVHGVNPEVHSALFVFCGFIVFVSNKAQLDWLCNPLKPLNMEKGMKSSSDEV